MPYQDPAVQREFQRNRVARRRAEWFAGKACVKCGSTDRLEIDHIDRSTKVSNSPWQWGAERMYAELAKCQVLCYTCHKAKTKSEVLAMCGTISAYRRGCRCDSCRGAHRDAARRWRQRPRQRDTGAGKLQ